MKAILIPSTINLNDIPDSRPQTKEELRRTLGLSPAIINKMIQDGKLEVSNKGLYQFTDKFHNMEF